MQKRKVEDNVIFELYNRIIAGESLTAVSKEIGLDRGTLRSYIGAVVEPNLSESEKDKFQQVINKNFRGNSTENKRKNRNDIRKRTAEEIEKSDAIKELADYGVTPQQIEELYNRLRSNTRTAFSRDTYIYKYLEHLNALGELGFSAEETFGIFMRRPKLFTGSASKMREIFNMHVRELKSEELAKQKMIEDPWADLKRKKVNLNDNKSEKSNGGGVR